MKQAEFIRETQMNGWRLWWANHNGLMFICGYQGCGGSVRIRDWREAAIPDRCDGEHINNFCAPAIYAYEDLVAELRRKRHLLGLSQEELGFGSGLADGHINKLEADGRTATLPTLLIWAGSLGYDITLTPAPVPPRILRMIESKAGRARPASPPAPAETG